MVIGPRSSPFVAKLAWTCLQLCCLPEPGESSTAVSRGYNRPAVPELPDLADRRRGIPRRPRRPSDRGRGGPRAARRAGHAGRARGTRRPARRRHPPARQVPARSTSIGIRSSSTRCSRADSSSPRPDEKLPTKTAVVLGFGAAPGVAEATGRAGRAAPTWMPADDETVEVRYRDPTQMGKVYLLPAGVDRDGARAWPTASSARTPTIRR